MGEKSHLAKDRLRGQIAAMSGPEAFELLAQLAPPARLDSISANTSAARSSDISETSE